MMIECKTNKGIITKIPYERGVHDGVLFGRSLASNGPIGMSLFYSDQTDTLSFRNLLSNQSLLLYFRLEKFQLRNF